MSQDMDGFFVDDAEKRCRNCQNPLPTRAKYCDQCGQKDYTGRIKLRTILLEVLETIFNIENKTFKTLGALFIPGKLTIEFFKGKHETYFRPIRLFLIMAILHFAVIAFVINQALEEELESERIENYSKAFTVSFLHQLDTLSEGIVPHFDDRSKRVENAVDSIESRIHATVSDSMGIPYLTGDGFLDIDMLTLNMEDIYTTPIREVSDKYEIEGFWSRISLKQVIRVQRNTDNLVSLIIGNLTWMILLMMPTLAFILKILYIRRDYFYVEHLIFSFHYHAFAFLIASPGYLLISVWGPSIAVSFGIILIYLFIAMRRVYKQGVIKTFIKYTALNYLYLFVFGFFITLMIIISALIV